MHIEKHHDRIEFMHIVYQLDFYDFQVESLLNVLEFHALKDRIDHYLTHRIAIDEIISESLTNYKLNRLSMVDRAILRVATFEMKYENLPKEIAINEALELTKTYSNLDDNKQVKFNNKVLDTISRML
jgi:N utilization substance protein B